MRALLSLLSLPLPLSLSLAVPRIVLPLKHAEEPPHRPCSTVTPPALALLMLGHLPSHRLAAFHITPAPHSSLSSTPAKFVLIHTTLNRGEQSVATSCEYVDLSQHLHLGFAAQRTTAPPHDDAARILTPFTTTVAHSTRVAARAAWVLTDAWL